MVAIRHKSAQVYQGGPLGISITLTRLPAVAGVPQGFEGSASFHPAQEAEVTKSNTGADIYLHFLQLSQRVRGAAALPALDPLEERMLGMIALALRRHERLCVRDLMTHAELGAPATIHGRLKSMREKGWVALADTEDARRKQVQVTAPAMRYFARLARCMVLAMR